MSDLTPITTLPPTSPVPTGPSDVPSTGPAPSGSPHVRTPAAVAIVVAALLIGLVVVGAVVKLSANTLSTGPALAPPTPTSSTPPIGYDTGTRLATYANLQVTLPGAPYECAPAPQPSLPSFSTSLSCDALVHEEFQPGRSWYASAGLAVVSTGVSVPSDPKTTGQRELESVRSQTYGSDKATLSAVTAQRAQGFANAYFVSGKISYEIKGLPSRSDKVALVVVQLDAAQVVWFSVRPIDSSKATLSALEASLNTLKVA
jgi:hypothetical protein